MERMERLLFCGVKFCGGCNPRYERIEALEKLKLHFSGKINFDYAKENENYDFLLVIGGCTNCCAAYDQFETKKGALKMWDETCIERISSNIEKFIKMED